MGLKRRIASGAVLGLLLALSTTPASAALEAEGLAASVGTGRSTWVQVSAGDRHTCGITPTARLFCWGSDAAGQLGDGGTNTDRGAPVEVAGGRRTWVEVSAGAVHTCARTVNGDLWCWGSDFWGQLGNGGANSDVGTPVQVTGGSGPWADVSAGYEHTCGVSRARHLWCWGKDGSGRLGDDDPVADRTTPTEVAGAGADWRTVTAGVFHSCAIKTTGRLFCWGVDSAGQLGDGLPLAERHTPVEVVGGRTDWTMVDLGRSHTCGLQRTGALSCWGWDDAGQLGDDAANTDQSAPAPVAGGALRWTSVSVGGYHSCAARRAAGGLSDQLFCWGLDAYGALGDDAALADQATPVAVAGSWAVLAGVDAGEYQTCARSRLGLLSCWGLDSNGQLGDGGTNTDKPTPVPVTG